MLSVSIDRLNIKVHVGTKLQWTENTMIDA